MGLPSAPSRTSVSTNIPAVVIGTRVPNSKTGGRFSSVVSLLPARKRCQERRKMVQGSMQRLDQVKVV